MRGGEIRVRRATPGEKIKTLDGKDRTLTSDMLVIADAQRAEAIGGVMGGAGSEVSDRTTRIVFEAAWFKPTSVRATSTAYVGITPPDVQRKPQVEGFRFAASATAEQLPGDRLAANSPQILAFFDYRQGAAAQSIRWVVLRDGRALYQSPALPWYGGDKGTWWVGLPAGGPDGGQWTSGDGIEGGDPEILSDVTPDDNWSPDAHYAQNDSLAGYPIDLNDERARGGHTIERHVNRTPDTLIAQALEAFETRPNAQDSRSGSFSSLEAATKLVNSTLAQNRAIIDEIASGARPHAVVFARFGSVTGIEAVAPNIRAQPYIRETHGVGVVVVHDRSSPRGYTVWTAFPSNR